MTFTLLINDTAGTVVVEMRGWGIKGPDPHEGERVRVEGSWDRRGVLAATRIIHADTGVATELGGKGRKRLEYIGVGVVVTFMVGMVAAGVVALIIALNGNSSDPTPAPGQPTLSVPAQVTVPQIEVGGPWPTALSRLQDAGLVGILRHDTSGSVPPGSVIRVDPASGSQVPRGSEVRVYISDGPG